MTSLLYLVPNLADPAVPRRISMLQAGGAQVEVAGFVRRGARMDGLQVDQSRILGETEDGRFGQRLLAVAGSLTSIRSLGRSLRAPDVIMARNLEMLPLANALRRFWKLKPSIVYECLDIHRLLLRQDAIGWGMRRAEKQLTQEVGLVVTSSPAFLRNYFDVYGSFDSLLIENKVPLDVSVRGSNPALNGGSSPLKIGWFGALRCRRSLRVLREVARQIAGEVEVVLRGKPALREFDDFHADVSAEQHLYYLGPYKNPEDLPSIYSEVHFAWAIDFFEAGQNSAWLLPNRLYEGCYHGAIPIAVDGTETANFIRRHGVGVVLPDVEPATVIRTLGQMTAERVRELAAAVAAVDSAVFSFDETNARSFVERISAPGFVHAIGRA